MLESYKWMGWIGLDWKSLKALILRAPLCGANKSQMKFDKLKKQKVVDCSELTKGLMAVLARYCLLRLPLKYIFYFYAFHV